MVGFSSRFGGQKVKGFYLLMCPKSMKLLSLLLFYGVRTIVSEMLSFLWSDFRQKLVLDWFHI